MTFEKNAPRLLGAAFLVVILTSLTNGLLFQTAVGSGNISEMLVTIAENTRQLRLSVFFEMLNASCIVILAVLLYTVLKSQSRLLARIALGWWLAEALILGLTSAGALALIPVSLGFVQAGAPQNSFHLVLGQFLYHGLHGYGFSGVHMWFYCIGGVLWYFLFYRSGYIPRLIPLYGMAAAALAFAAVLMGYFGYDAPLWMSIPLLPFELTIGCWLLFKGIWEAPHPSVTQPPVLAAGN